MLGVSDEECLFSFRRTETGLLPFIGAWRSLVARLPWAQEVPGSNPGAPTIDPKGLSRQDLISER